MRIFVLKSRRHFVGRRRRRRRSSGADVDGKFFSRYLMKIFLVSIIFTIKISRCRRSFVGVRWSMVTTIIRSMITVHIRSSTEFHRFYGIIGRGRRSMSTASIVRSMRIVTVPAAAVIVLISGIILCVILFVLGKIIRISSSIRRIPVSRMGLIRT